MCRCLYYLLFIILLKPIMGTDKGCSFRLEMRCKRWRRWWCEHSCSPWFHGNPLQHSLAFLNPIRRKSEESQVLMVRFSWPYITGSALSQVSLIVTAAMPTMVAMAPWTFNRQRSNQRASSYDFSRTMPTNNVCQPITLIFCWLDAPVVSGALYCIAGRSVWVETKDESSLNFRAPS